MVTVEEAHELAVLRGDCVAGRITLGDFARRARVLTGDAPGAEVEVFDEQPSSGSGRDGVRWGVAVLASVRHRVRGLVPPKVTAVALFGACRMDLADARVVGDDLDVRAVPVFGTVKVVVPRGLDVVVTGAPVFGTVKDLDGDAAAAPVPGAPIVRVRCWAVFGTVKVQRTD